MRTLTKRMIQHKFDAEVMRQLEHDANEMLNNERERIAYESLACAMPNAVRQIEATVLYSLSLHGYGAKRLNDFHEWFCAITKMPANIMGKTAQANQMIESMTKKYGIDFSKVVCNFPTYEEYLKQQEEQGGLS